MGYSLPTRPSLILVFQKRNVLPFLFTSNTHLIEWMNLHVTDAQVSQKVYVVTNRYRANDGGDLAAELLIKTVRGTVEQVLSLSAKPLPSQSC